MVKKLVNYMTKAKNIYDSNTNVEQQKVLQSQTNGYRKVPISVFMSTVGLMFTIICSLTAWTWSATTERQKLAADLAFQFEKQASIAVKSAEVKFSEASQRMDRIQGDVREVRDMLSRHIELDKPGR